MSKQINVRLDDIHAAMLDKMVDVLTDKGIKTSKTDVIQKALYYFARENVLGADVSGEIIDKHYKGDIPGLGK